MSTAPTPQGSWQPRHLPLAAAALATLLLLLAAGAAHALPAGFTQATVGSGWNEVVGMTFDANGNMFAWERGGRIYSVDPAGVKTEILDISDEVGGWRDYGLLGVALHPNFLSNRQIFLLYVVDRHHLLHAGTPSYDPNTDEYFAATIGRIARYTLTPDFLDTDYGSRFVLVGETISSGIPILHQSHGTGSLAFGTDGTLLASMGDGASYSSTDTGSASETYYLDGLADGIIRPEENVGAFRAQMLDSFNGKILRLDPETGDGVDSNPWYDAAFPRAVHSRIFALGLRNPYRITLRPGTGSHDPDDADPGDLYIGDVGWGTWEDVHVMDSPGQNFGWPNFEGIDPHTGYTNSNTPNQDAPNPLFGQDISGQGVCTQQYFTFSELLHQATLDPSHRFPNSCDPAQDIPASLTHIHSRPEIDYRHGSGPSRWTSFDGFDPVTTNIGPATDPNGKSVPGPQFGGNTATAGVWYVGTDLPTAEYQNTYFHADYGSQWIRQMLFDANNEPVEVRDFHGGGGGIVHMATHPIDGGLYYIQWASNIWKVDWVGFGNEPPTAVASLDVQYGPSPHTVQFTGDQSTDPDSTILTYLWDFGDGDTSTLANPSHQFTAPPSTPTGYQVTLTVTDDDLNASAPATLLVSVNNTPPVVTITSPVDGSLYSMEGLGESDPLIATISDAEQGAGFTCVWGRALHHNDHDHPEPAINDCTTAELITYTPVGCDGNTYFYRASLSVTDNGGLTTVASADVHPDCPNVPPIATNDTDTVAQGYAVVVDVLANDFDSDGAIDPTTVTVVSPPANGLTSVDPAGGAITYTHDGSAATTDSFTYTVDDDEGAPSNEATVDITAFNNPPTVSIVSPVDLSTFDVDDFIGLQANGNDPEDGGAVSYHWEIDRIHGAARIPGVFVYDGEFPPSWQVPDVGLPGDHISYLVEVTVTDLVGAVATDEVHILPATPPANTPPVASFIGSPTLGSAPLVVNVDATASSDADGDYLLYDWDFGDGSSATGVAAQHTYDVEGSYTISLTVTDAVGSTDTSVLGVDVLSPGLEGTYYDAIDLTNEVLTRVDPIIDFDWGSGSPDPSIGADTFSIRWVGQIEPLFSETYTIYTVSDDGIRVWIGGNLVIDSWINQAPTEHSGTIALAAGTRYDITIEYYENGGGAVARLLWSSASQPKLVVPAGQLFGPPPPNQPPFAVDDEAGTLSGFSVPIDVLANDFDDRNEIDPTTVAAGNGSNGTTSVDPVTGVVTYNHDGITVGTDFFTYTVDDLDGATSNVATVEVNVLDPSAIAITSPSEGANLVGPDVTVTYTLSGDPSLYDHIHWRVDGGSPTMDFALNGSFTFTSVSVGPHAFSGELVNGQHQPLGFPNSLDSVNATILPSNTPPVAADDIASAIQGNGVAIDVLANDTDDKGIDPTTVAPSTATNGLVSADPVTGIVTYTHDGTLTASDSFTYTVDDNEGATSNVATVSISISDPNLTLDALTGNVGVDEGESFAFQATATHLLGETITFDWDLDGDSQYDDLSESPGTGTQASGGNTSLPDEGVYTLGVRVSDGVGRELFGSFVATVQNVAPGLDALTGDLTVQTGEAFTYSATASDPGAADVLTFDWDLDGDGQFDDFNTVTGPSPQTTGGSTSLASIGTFTLGVRVSDGDAGQVTGTFEVTVLNADPTVDSITADLTVDEASSFAFSASASDFDVADPLTFEWDLDGDGQYDDLTEVKGAGPQTSNGTTSLPDDGVYTLGVRVTDGSAGTATASFDVTVQNVAPVIRADWAARRLLTFDNSGQAEALSDFPVLVSLDASRIDYGLVQAGGIDLLFTDMADTPLAHEIEHWDPAGVSTVWVEVPQISAASATDSIWMLYGNPEITQSSEDPSAVWSNGYAAVWHLHDDLLDSTANGNDGANNGSTDVPGAFGDGQYFDQTSWIDMGTSPSLEIAGDITLEAWIKIDDAALDAASRLLSKKDTWDATSGYNLEHKPLEDNVTSVGSGPDYIRAATVGIDAVSWHYVVTAASGAAGAVYVDGVDRTTDATLTPIVAGSQPLNLGRRSGDGDYYLGAMDEVRISSVQRSGDWIAAQHLSMTDAFVTFGSEEALNPTTADVAVDEGETFPFTTTASDVGPLDVLTFDWDLDGDGQYDDLSESPGTVLQSSGGTTALIDDGVFTLGVQVGDGDGGVASDSFQATVANVAPTLDALTGDLTVKRGELFAYSATASDVGSADVLTFSWDLDGDTLHDDLLYVGGAGAGSSSGTTSLPDVGPHTLGVLVDDGDGGAVSDTFDVTVQALAGGGLGLQMNGDLTAQEGQAFSFWAMASGAQSPVTYDWELDGDAQYDDHSEAIADGMVSGGAASMTNDGVYALGVRVSDGAGGEDYGTFGVTVTNAAPEITHLTGGLVALPDAVFGFSATATDPGALDALTFEWDLDGDGQFDDLVDARGAGSQISSGATSLPSEGAYTLRVRVSDGDGGVTTGSFAVLVSANGAGVQVPGLLGPGLAGLVLLLAGAGVVRVWGRVRDASEA